MGGGGGNATSLDETLLYSGNDQITSISGYKDYTLSDNLSNYDYVFLEIIGKYETGTDDYLVTGTYSVGSGLYNNQDSIVYWGNSQGGTTNLAQFGGWIKFTDEDTVRFALRYKGNEITSVYLRKIVGIKKNSLSTADIAEMAMPSDVYITIPTNTDWTAITNGEVRFRLTKPNNSVSAPVLRINNDIVYDYAFTGSVDWTVAFSKIVKKGDIVNLSTTDTVNFSKFFYSVGDAKALGLI